MSRTWLAGVAAIAALGTAGCLQSETTHRLYLTPEGAVTWVVLERDVFSDERETADGLAEDREFLASARIEAHPMALAFEALANDARRSMILREEVPFTVLTEARFSRVDWLGQRVLDRLRLPGTSVLGQEGDEMYWTLTVDTTVDVDEGAATELEPLVADASDYRVFLTEGRFTAATGFRIVSGGVAVEPVDDNDAHEGPESETLVLSLRWRLPAR
jgi:hypothetical protein